MSRENFVFVALLLAFSALPPVSGAAERKLVWTYPCTFAYNDAAGAQYENKISSPECDFIHAKFGKNSARDFNQYTSTAQYVFLDDVAGESGQAYHFYQAVIQEVLKETDPATLAPSLAPKDRLAKLMQFHGVLLSNTYASFKPFQWESPAESSYLYKDGGGLPKSWNPYVDPVRERVSLLNQLIQPLQGQMVGDAATHLASKIEAMDKLKKLSPTAEDWLAKLWGGPPAAPGGLPDPALPGPTGSSKAGAPLLALTPPYSPKLAPPAPLPQTAQAQAKYDNFRRGYKEGLQRVDDEASIAWWHYSGQTQTVGDPVGKSNLVFQQQGGSCALGSQFQALEARGKITPTKDDSAMRAFVQKAQQDGYFVEIRDKTGQTYGGTSGANLDKMLTAYNVPHTVKFRATQQDMDRAVLQSGDAIVTVEAGSFWKDPNVQGGHAVYVTGAEVDKTGRVVGYYFNDTGTGEGVRFVSVADFNKAWTHGLITFTPSNGK